MFFSNRRSLSEEVVRELKFTCAPEFLFEAEIILDQTLWVVATFRRNFVTDASNFINEGIWVHVSLSDLSMSASISASVRGIAVCRDSSPSYLYFPETRRSSCNSL